MTGHYKKQVQLLVRILPLIDSEKCFALKGGTAINLFYRNMPRLSVDIDLLYVPLDDREKALETIRAALGRISELIQKTIRESKVHNVHEQTDALRLIVQNGDVRIKIELSPVIRGTIFPERRMKIADPVEKEYGFAEIQLASFEDLYAGKLCAALDRQHPRDLFDVKFLFDNEGLTDELRKAFLVFLISHQRPIAELLQPNFKDISGIYETEFAQMAQEEVPLKELEKTRERLVNEIRNKITTEEKNFLLSFKAIKPDWNLLGMSNPDQIASLPSVRWKLQNLRTMSAKKHEEAYEKLKAVLFDS